jgi:hypothetical protein
MVCSFACASEKRGLCSQDVRRLETPEIKYLSPCSLITLCSLGTEIENGVSPRLVFINFISFSNEVAFMVVQREPLLTAESDRPSSCTIKVHKNRVAANKAKLANNGLNKGSPSKCDCEHPANKALKSALPYFGGASSSLPQFFDSVSAFFQDSKYSVQLSSAYVTLE